MMTNARLVYTTDPKLKDKVVPIPLDGMGDVKTHLNGEIQFLNEIRRRPPMKEKITGAMRADGKKRRILLGHRIIDLLFPKNTLKIQDLFKLLFPGRVIDKKAKTYLRNVLSNLRTATREVVFCEKFFWRISKFDGPVSQIHEAWELNYGKIWVGSKDKPRKLRKVSDDKPPVPSKEEQEEALKRLTSKEVVVLKDNKEATISLTVGDKVELQITESSIKLSVGEKIKLSIDF